MNLPKLEFPEPTSKQELTDTINRVFDQLIATIQSLTPEDMVISETEGQWSVKDHLAHLAIWRRKVLADMQERPPWEALGIGQKEMQENNTDGINALIYQHWRSRSLEDVIDALKTSHSALMYQLNKMSEERIFHTYTPVGSDVPRRMVEGIIGDTYEHDLEHQVYVGEMIESRQKRRANLS